MRRFVSMGNACTSVRSETSFSEPAKRIQTGKDNLLSISASFKFHDLKDDGVIDSEELLAYFKSDQTVAAIIERLDKNRDGVISYSEFYSEVSKIKDGEATLQTYLEKFPLKIEAIAPPPNKPQRTLPLQGREVTLTWASHVDDNDIVKIYKFGPFTDWMEQINRIENPDLAKPELIVDKVHIQHIDMFGPRIGFLKFQVAARKWNEKMNEVAFVPGIVFMRGGAVGILCILIEAETGKEYALITLQPRIPVGYADFAEIPAGMLDGEPNHQRFAGKAAKEMNEETLLEIKDTELYDLTQLAYSSKYKGMYPSAGGCDEFLKLYLYRRYISREVLDLLKMAHGGEGASEVIKLKVVPLENLWREAPDAKALSALYLYTKFQELKIHHPPTLQNFEQEEQLKVLLKPKIAHNEGKKQKEAEKQKEGDKQKGEEEKQHEGANHKEERHKGQVDEIHQQIEKLDVAPIEENEDMTEEGGEKEASDDANSPLLEDK
jgi:ADP-sugar diphosphatase